MLRDYEKMKGRFNSGMPIDIRTLTAKEIPIKEFKTEKQREIVASRLGNDLTYQVYSEKEIAVTDIYKAIKPLDHIQNIEQNLEAK